jgi:hypothetical protein
MPAPHAALTRGIELGADRQMVVDLAVERDHPAAILGCHRLVTKRCQIDDRQTPVPEHDAGLEIIPTPRIVRPAMRQTPRHPIDQRRVACARKDRAGYATHFMHSTAWHISFAHGKVCVTAVAEERKSDAHLRSCLIDRVNRRL